MDGIVTLWERDGDTPSSSQARQKKNFPFFSPFFFSSSVNPLVVNLQVFSRSVTLPRPITFWLVSFLVVSEIFFSFFVVFFLFFFLFLLLFLLRQISGTLFPLPLPNTTQNQKLIQNKKALNERRRRRRRGGRVGKGKRGEGKRKRRKGGGGRGEGGGKGKRGEKVEGRREKEKSSIIIIFVVVGCVSQYRAPPFFTFCIYL